MNTTSMIRTLTYGIFALTTIAAPLASRAEIRSKSGELVVMEPHNLPEQAQMTGNSMFLYSDNSGDTYLYVEQEQGARLTVFDVTDPAHIKTVSSTPLTVAGPFDFVRPLDGSAELLHFRDGKGVAVLDLKKAAKPTVRTVAGLVNPGRTESLGESGYLGVNEPYEYVRATPRDFQVVDISTPSDPALLATVKQVKHRVVNGDTGTTFLLGSDGLTVIRRTSVENDYKTHLMQMQGN
jgi:hypothetical protein